MKVVTTLLKLIFAAAVLCLGWMTLKPLATAGWPLDWLVQSWIERIAGVGLVDRIGLGVVALLFGAACLLAAMPKSVKDRSPKKRTQPLSVAPVAMEAEPPVAMPVSAPAEVHSDPFSPLTAVAAPTSPDPFPAAQPVLHAPPEAEAAPAVSPSPEIETAPVDFIDELVGARRALIADPTPATRSHLADLLKKDGDIAEGEGRLDHAITAYEESVELRRAVLAADDHNARELRWLWTTLESLAECREDRGHRTRAAALYREGLEAGERARVLAPEETAYPGELETTRARLSALEAQLVV